MRIRSGRTSFTRWASQLSAAGLYSAPCCNCHRLNSTRQICFWWFRDLSLEESSVANAVQTPQYSQSAGRAEVAAVATRLWSGSTCGHWSVSNIVARAIGRVTQMIRPAGLKYFHSPGTGAVFLPVRVPASDIVPFLRSATASHSSLRASFRNCWCSKGESNRTAPVY
jgi:hypothetical protein